MKKSTLIMALALILSLALGVGGTLAYLTDRDSETNIFTLGNVDIELNEDFTQGAELLPGKTIEKVPTITNTGSTAAYVWYTWAIPAAFDSWNPGTEEGSNENVIHWNPTGATTEGYVNETRVAKAIGQGLLPEGTTAEAILADNKTWDVFNELVDGANCYREVINGKDYNVYVLPYNKALQPGETTLPSVYEVDMDVRVDIAPDGEMYFVENGVTTKLNWNVNDDGAPIIYVNAYGIQAEGFADVDAAYAAYVGQWSKLNGTYETAVKADDAAALEAAIKDGASIIELGAGTYTIPAAAKGKDITIVGSKETVIDATYSYGQSLSGADITLSGVTVKGQASGNYAGFTHVGSMTLNGCDIEGKITLYAPTVFNDCTLTNMKDYSVWTWGANEVEFNNCTFVSGGKALLVYGGNSESCKHVDVTVNDCVFESDGSVATDKAAIETGNDYGTSYNIVINDITVDSDFGPGKNTGSKTWANKTEMSSDVLNVVINGYDEY